MIIRLKKIVLPVKMRTYVSFYDDYYNLICSFEFVQYTSSREILCVNASHDQELHPISKEYRNYIKNNIHNATTKKVTCNDLLRYLKRKNDVLEYHKPNQKIIIEKDDIEKFIEMIYDCVESGKANNAIDIMYIVHNLKCSLN
jgi:hypothetical protein